MTLKERYEYAKEKYAKIGVDTDKAIEILKANGEDAYRLGVIGEGSGVQLV